MNDEQDYIAMLERTQIPEDHPLIRHLKMEIPDARPAVSVDDLIQDLESRGLGWSICHAENRMEAQVYLGPYVIERYRFDTVLPLAQMLAKVMYEVNWTNHPKK